MPQGIYHSSWQWFFILKSARTTKYLNPVRRGCASTVPVEKKYGILWILFGSYLMLSSLKPSVKLILACFGSNCVHDFLMQLGCIKMTLEFDRIWFGLKKSWGEHFRKILKTLIETTPLRYTITCATYSAGQAMLWVWLSDQISLCAFYFSSEA